MLPKTRSESSGTASRRSLGVSAGLPAGRERRVKEDEVERKRRGRKMRRGERRGHALSGPRPSEETHSNNAEFGIVPINVPPLLRYLDTFSIIILALAGVSNA